MINHHQLIRKLRTVIFCLRKLECGFVIIKIISGHLNDVGDYSISLLLNDDETSPFFQTPTVKNSNEPTWNYGILFFYFKLEKFLEV